MRNALVFFALFIWIAIGAALSAIGIYKLTVEAQNGGWFLFGGIAMLFIIFVAAAPQRASQPLKTYSLTMEVGEIKTEKRGDNYRYAEVFGKDGSSFKAYIKEGLVGLIAKGKKLTLHYAEMDDNEFEILEITEPA